MSNKKDPCEDCEHLFTCVTACTKAIGWEDLSKKDRIREGNYKPKGLGALISLTEHKTVVKNGGSS